MRVAIVGSRGYPRLDLVRACVGRLAEFSARVGWPMVIVSGTRPDFGRTWHVDETAVDEARKCGLEAVIHPAEWDRLGRGAGLQRNSLIVDDADFVVAFWDRDDHRGWSRGTADTIRKAMMAGNLRKVYGPDGEPMGFDIVGELVRQILGE